MNILWRYSEMDFSNCLESLLKLIFNQSNLKQCEMSFHLDWKLLTVTVVNGQWKNVAIHVLQKTKCSGKIVILKRDIKDEEFWD